jgi:hypothetical protein
MGKLKFEGFEMLFPDFIVVLENGTIYKMSGYRQFHAINQHEMGTRI